jgi:hypothetical protein
VVATAVAGSTGSYPQAPGAASSGATLPFFYGSNQYVEKITTDTYTLTASTQEFVHNITPGGFLRGVRLEVRTTGTAPSGGLATADNPWNLFSSISLENIDGSPIQYPMSGYTYYAANMHFRPWFGDPAKRYDFVAGNAPSFSLFIQPEIRHTAGVLANTDARALYRIRYTVNTQAQLLSGAINTAPTVAITTYLESWAQPDDRDLHGNPIEPIPVGLSLQTMRRHQTLSLNSAGASNIFQLANTGNELRGILLIVRDSNNARQDYLTDPIRWRLDNRAMGTFSPNELFNRMNDFYDFYSNGTSTRPTGVYCFSRFFQPGALKGEAWLPTTNATYLIFESSTLSSGTNLPGTVEMVTDEVIPVGNNLPVELESI